MKCGTYSLCLLAGLLLAVTIAQCDREPQELGDPARSRFQLSKVFDFSKYKQLFNKSYGSVIEELARQKLFLAKFFRAIISRVKYRHEKSDHYLSVNHLSDRTPAEISRMYPRPEALAKDIKRLAGHVSLDDQEEPGIPAADEDEFYDALSEIEENSDQPGYREIAQEIEEVQRELAEGDQKRRKRDIASSRSEKLRGDMIESPGSSDQAAFDGPAPESNNPHYEPPELISSGDPELDEENQNANSHVSSFISGAKNYLSGLMHQTTTTLTAVKSDEASTEKRLGGDKVRIDLRKTNCISPPRSQGECGSCYAFAAISLYEFLYCQATGKLVPFSEQYILDCGTMWDLNGCNGGDIHLTMDFIETFGLELRKNYPYRFKKETCPYPKGTNFASMGYLRVKRRPDVLPGVFSGVSISMMDRKLDRPIYHAIKIPEDFSEYGGGVHNVVNCKQDSGHAMLIVGQGVEDGIQYYLMKNSHSESWGEKGYFKLGMQGIHFCSIYKYGLQTHSSFEYKNTDEMNPLYDADLIKKHYDSHIIGNWFLSSMNSE